MRAEAKITSENHIPELDGLRGLASLLVVFAHGTAIISHSWIDSAYGLATKVGWVGVDLFFVLSAFLITGILCRTKLDPRYFRNFYARRALRIWPAYYLFLAVVFGASRIWDTGPLLPTGWGQLGWYLFFLSNLNFSGGISVALSVTWSVALEEQFYLVWPWILRFVDRRRLMRLCLLAILVTPVVRAATIGHFNSILVYYCTLTRLDTLAMGAWIALALQNADDARRVRRWNAPVMALAGCVAGLVYLHDRTSSGPWIQAVGYSAFGIFFSGLLVRSIPEGRPNFWHRTLRHPWTVFFGRYSYGFYLFHLPLQVVAGDLLAPWIPLQFSLLGSAALGSFVRTVLISLPGLGAAVVSYHLYEVRFLSWKRYFGGAAPPPICQLTSAALASHP